MCILAAHSEPCPTIHAVSSSLPAFYQRGLHQLPPSWACAHLHSSLQVPPAALNGATHGSPFKGGARRVLWCCQAPVSSSGRSLPLQSCSSHSLSLSSHICCLLCVCVWRQRQRVCGVVVLLPAYARLHMLCGCQYVCANVDVYFLNFLLSTVTTSASDSNTHHVFLVSFTLLPPSPDRGGSVTHCLKGRLCLSERSFYRLKFNNSDKRPCQDAI